MIDYKAYDKQVRYLADKLEIIKKRFPQYKWYSEYIHKEYMLGKSCRQIADQLKETGMTREAVLTRLRKMGIERRPRGGRNNPKLTEADVRVIRKSNESTKKLADFFGVTKRPIQRIRANEAWKGV